MYFLHKIKFAEFFPVLEEVMASVGRTILPHISGVAQRGIKLPKAIIKAWAYFSYLATFVFFTENELKKSEREGGTMSL